VTREVFDPEQPDWDSILPDLVAYGCWWAGQVAWARGDGWELAQGQTVLDCVLSVVEKLLDGTRPYDPKIPLVAWLKTALKSEISNLHSHLTTRSETRLPTNPDLGDVDEADDRPYRQVADPRTQSPEEAALDNARFQEAYHAIYNAVADDQELVEILVAVTDGCELKPQALADELHVPVANINNRIKRWDRRIKKLMSKGGKP
jgi:DNA-directed RNA polymerase specialized sigma24 family protein